MKKRLQLTTHCGKRRRPSLTSSKGNSSGSEASRKQEQTHKRSSAFAPRWSRHHPRRASPRPPSHQCQPPVPRLSQSYWTPAMGLGGRQRWGGSHRTRRQRPGIAGDWCHGGLGTRRGLGPPVRRGRGSLRDPTLGRASTPVDRVREGGLGFLRLSFLRGSREWFQIGCHFWVFFGHICLFSSNFCLKNFQLIHLTKLAIITEATEKKIFIYLLRVNERKYRLGGKWFFFFFK